MMTITDQMLEAGMKEAGRLNYAIPIVTLAHILAAAIHAGTGTPAIIENEELVNQLLVQRLGEIERKFGNIEKYLANVDPAIQFARVVMEQTQNAPKESLDSQPDRSRGSGWSLPWIRVGRNGGNPDGRAS